MDAELCFCDMTKLDSYAAFYVGIGPEYGVIIAGGHGTLNRFINDTEGLSVPNDILYYALGSGNDYLKDLNKEEG